MQKSARELALIAIFTAVNCISTTLIQVYIPATKGYFNVGESTVYITAMLFGPKVGALAGALGPALADVATGYYIYAPATAVIKGLEGLVVGLLSRRAVRRRIPGYLYALAPSVLLLIIGIMYYTGSSELTIGIPKLNTTILVEIHYLAWIITAVVAAAALTYVARSPECLQWVISASAGGAIMVLGYFLYEQLVLGYYAIAEVPFNIAQVLVGILIAVPTVSTLSRRLPSSSRRFLLDSSAIK